MFYELSCKEENKPSTVNMPPNGINFGPCQVQAIGVRPNSGSSGRTSALGMVDTHQVNRVRRQLFGAPAPGETERMLDNEMQRQRERLSRYQQMTTVLDAKKNTRDNLTGKEIADTVVCKKHSLPSLIAKELEQHEKVLRMQQQKNNGDVTNWRQELAETTPTLLAKVKLRTRHTSVSGSNSSDLISTDAATEDGDADSSDGSTAGDSNNKTVCSSGGNTTRYRPYTRQPLITDVMQKRKSIPPP